MSKTVIVRARKSFMTRTRDNVRLEIRRGWVGALDEQHAKALLVNNLIEIEAETKQILPTETQVMMPDEIKSNPPVLEVDAQPEGATLLEGTAEGDDRPPIAEPEPETVPEPAINVAEILKQRLATIDTSKPDKPSEPRARSIETGAPRRAPVKPKDK